LYEAKLRGQIRAGHAGNERESIHEAIHAGKPRGVIGGCGREHRDQLGTVDLERPEVAVLDPEQRRIDRLAVRDRRLLLLLHVQRGHGGPVARGVRVLRVLEVFDDVPEDLGLVREPAVAGDLAQQAARQGDPEDRVRGVRGADLGVAAGRLAVVGVVLELLEAELADVADHAGDLVTRQRGRVDRALGGGADEGAVLEQRERWHLRERRTDPECRAIGELDRDGRRLRHGRRSRDISRCRRGLRRRAGDENEENQAHGR